VDYEVFMRTAKPDGARRHTFVPVSLLLVLALGASSFAYVSGRHKGVQRSPTCATLTKGARGPAVTTIQSYVGARADGDFGPHTAAALRRWQRHHRLPPTGAVDASTWAALPQDVALAACSQQAHGDGISMTCAYLHQGSTGPAVKVLQAKLHVGVDGDFGPRTQAAVVRAQRAAKLVGGGVVGPATWAELGLSGTPACRALPPHHLSRHAEAVRAVAREAATFAAVLVRRSGSTTNPIALAALHFAEHQKGKPYEWGGVGPKAYDCSGLMMKAYARAGVTIPRVANDQYGAGEPVPLSSARAGDLLFYATDVTNPRSIHHVVIYLGHGRVLDAPYTGAFVGVRPLWTDGLLPVAVRPTAQLHFPLRPGTTSPSVKMLQQMLNRHGASLHVDGYYGPRTTVAVNAWKKRHHLKRDGIVRRAMWLSLI
jgi:peptidoglycan hydrolase-like protein with peptidoglycan-binding domain